MSDAAGRELGELRREIIEARNQAIKTDNQVKNLSLDVKGFEKRFDNLDRRGRLASVGVHLIVALSIGFAAYAVASVRSRAFETEIAELHAKLKSVSETPHDSTDQAQMRLTDIEKSRKVREQAGDTAARIYDLLEAKKDKEAGELLEGLVVADLSPLERKLMEKRLSDLRKRVSDSAIKSAKLANSQGRPEVALNELKHALALEADAKTMVQARSLYGTTLWALHRYQDAEPVLREAVQNESDRAMLEELRYDLATSLARLGKIEDSKALLSQIAAVNGRYTTAAKTYLSAIEDNNELPTDLGGGKVRTAPPRKADAANPAAPSGPSD